MRVPKYRKHKASGQAIVSLSGHDHYLGRHGSPESHQKYERLISLWIANGRSPIIEATPHMTVQEVLAAWLMQALPGRDSAGQSRLKKTVGVAVRLYGDTPAAEFRGRALKAVRARMVEMDWARDTVNARVRILQRAWRWCLSEEMVTGDSAESVAAVAPLRRGEAGTRDTKAVLPVDQGVALKAIATLEKASPFLADAARVQMLSGLRPNEALRLRYDEMDDLGDVWVWKPAHHKTAFRGKGKAHVLGPRAVEILRPYFRLACASCGVEGRSGHLFRLDAPGLCRACATTARAGPYRTALAADQGHFFSPVQAKLERDERKRTRRKMPVQPSQACRKLRNPQRAPGEVYRTTSYCQAVARACVRAGVSHWHPNQLRHLAATIARARFDTETTRALLGHGSLSTTEIYASIDLEKAIKAAREIG